MGLAEIVFWALLAAAFAAAVVFRPRLRPLAPRLATSQSLMAAAPMRPPAAATLPASQLRETFDSASDAARLHLLSRRVRKPHPAERHASVRAIIAPRMSPAPVSELTQDEWRELVRLADEDPEEALRRIDRMPAVERRLPQVRLLRIFALGNAVWGDDDPARDPEEFLRNLSPKHKRYAEDGVEELAALERDVPDFFKDRDLENLVNRVCIPFEFHHAGGVQRALGWTKIGFWILSGRHFVLDENDPVTEDLKNLPAGVKSDMLFTRFSCPRIVMSSCLVGARRMPDGWLAGFILGARTSSAGTKVGDMDPFAVLTVHEDGRWNVVLLGAERADSAPFGPARTAPSALAALPAAALDPLSAQELHAWPALERSNTRTAAFRAVRLAAPHNALREDEWDELLRLAHDDPAAALERIDRLPAAERRHPQVRLARIYALGNLIWGKDGVADVEAFLRTLAPERLARAEQGVAELAVLEREAPDFFAGGEFESIVNRICAPLEYHRAGAVQRALAWTKILYWAYNRDRYFVLDENDPSTDDLANLPPKALVAMEAARFACPRIVLSACLTAARRTAEGWVGSFVLGARKGAPRTKVRDLAPIGILSMREDGSWRFSATGTTRASADPRLDDASAGLARAVAQFRGLAAQLDPR